MSTIPAAIAPTVTPDFAERETQALASAAAVVSFTGLTKTVYRLSCGIVKDGTAGVVGFRLNGDAGTSYDYQFLKGSGTVTGGRNLAQSAVFHPDTSAVANSSLTIDIIIAKTLSSAKAVLLGSATVTSSAGIETWGTGGLWANVAALVTQVDVIQAGGSFAAESTFVLEDA